jgi:CCR4-NOT transcription complex subunit 1
VDLATLGIRIENGQVLATTAALFGRLIQHRLVAGTSLGVALRCVLDAARSPPGGKMFRFAATALAQFKGDWAAVPALVERLKALQDRS